MPISLTTQQNGLSGTYNIPRFGGDIWYVDASITASIDGKTPATAFKTIGEGITAMGDGDALNIKAGTYTEVGLNLSNASAEMWFEIGAIIAPATGTALTISGAYCKLQCPGGSLRVNPAQNQTGVLVTGIWAYLSDVRVPCDGGTVGASADYGFDITGGGCVLTNCRCSSPDVAAFKIQGDKIKLEDCCTGGNPGYSSIGFWFTNSCDKARVKSCGSQGHETSGFQVDTGCTNGVIEECYSGGGDGRWSDADNSFVWANFSFDDHVYHTTTFSAAGPGTDNLFKITGAVLITAFFGDVEDVLSADIGNCHLELYDGTNTVDVTDSPGPDFASLPVGTYIHKIDDAAVQIAIENSSQIRLYEDATKFGQDPNFQVIGKAGVSNYIRLVYSGTGTSGAIHWHCQWEPLTEDGFVEAA